MAERPSCWRRGAPSWRRNHAQWTSGSAGTRIESAPISDSALLDQPQESADDCHAIAAVHGVRVGCGSAAQRQEQRPADDQHGRADTPPHLCPLGGLAHLHGAPGRGKRPSPTRAAAQPLTAGPRSGRPGCTGRHPASASLRPPPGERRQARRGTGRHRRAGPPRPSARRNRSPTGSPRTGRARSAASRAGRSWCTWRSSLRWPARTGPGCRVLSRRAAPPRAPRRASASARHGRCSHRKPASSATTPSDPATPSRSPSPPTPTATASSGADPRASG